VKLLDMVNELYGSYGNQYEVEQPQILRYIDIAQKAAFNHDCKAFERMAILDNQVESDTPGMGYYDFPEDAREIISVHGFQSYYIDIMKRRINAPFMPTINGKALYYLRPETLKLFNDDDKVIVPDEWRWQVLVMPAAALCDTANYDEKTPQSAIENFFKEWWEAMNARPNDRQPVISAGAW
jgi:hypothetical protein